MLINLKDMLESRQEGWEKVNKKWGTNWTIKLKDDLDYVNDFVNPNVDFGKGEANEKDN